MRDLGTPFNAVSREQLIFEIYDRVRPIDSYTDNSQTLENPGTVVADVVDPALISLEWYVNGVLVANESAQTFDTSWMSKGLYNLSVRSYDPTDWVRAS